ncbi:glycosyltransferase family 2 protein [Reichenbachiella versicolor]|uniref:glycosyltransferase family 2 protein n=1 Tax=Reichenbachiella versicolor TaxID=1821036 RepID=UPI001FECDB43|nr:glycosyltransferase family 2 protein [Reichenbachiella versicolor]
MATKDTAPYLSACLDSILNQTYQNWELLAVNDHSSDDTPQILAEYAKIDSRIKYYDSTAPKLIPTLQFAYARCTGELINRMDSDDKMPEYKLQVMYEEWVKYGKGHVIAGGTEHFVDQGEVGGGFRRYEQWLNQVAREGRHLEEIYTECVIPSHSWLLHKEDMDAVGAFDSDIYPEDYDLCFRFYKQKLKIIGIDYVLHYWRDRGDRISRTWDVYKDNRYFSLKLNNFFTLDRDQKRPLVLWGAGRNGKDIAKLLSERNQKFIWVCDSDSKIGKDIYGVRMKHYSTILELDNPQIMIVVSSPDGKIEIKAQLDSMSKKVIEDYWFFA